MADINSLVAKVRLELGDLGKSFVTQFTADGSTNRFRLHYEPLDAESVAVIANGIDVTTHSSVEESTGTLVVDLTPVGVAITSATKGTSVSTYTTAIPHGLSVGQMVSVIGATTTSGSLNFNVTDRTVSATTSTTFSIDYGSSGPGGTATGGTVYLTSLAAIGSPVPKEGVNFTISGTYYRYFTAAELSSLVENAVEQHGAKHVDALGRKYTVADLPAIEEYPVAVYATTLALYTLATDSAFDIDIMAPDGVSVPRSERYRQLMDMMQARQIQYKDLCAQLGIGLYSIDMFVLRRTSKTTNRLVPVYKPQEVDDRSFPQRVRTPLPTYGDANVAFPTEVGELTAYQGRKFNATVPFTGDYSNKSFVASLRQQRGGIQVVQNFALEVTSTGNDYLAELSLTADQTLRIAQRTWWQIEIIDDDTSEREVLLEGNFFTVRVRESVL